MSINSIEAGPIECPACKEIELRLDHMVREPEDNHTLFGEYVCAACGHLEILESDNPDYDPTPDEPGEPPITMLERYQASKPR